MKNKYKLLFLNIFIFLSILIINTKASEQFKFDVTELEITDNGNKFKGLKRGIVIGNNGILISANSFEYNKLTNILDAVGNVEVFDEINDYKLYAEKITYLKNEEKFFTEGKTRAIIESKYNLISKNVIFLRDKKELYSSEEVEIKDDKFTSYKLKNFKYYIQSGEVRGNNIEILSNYSKNSNDRDLFQFTNGIFNLKTKNYNSKNPRIYLKKNTFEKKENDPRIYGVSSNKSGEILTVNNGIFTSCALNHKCPPWSVKAQKIQHNQKKKQLIYKNAFINVYDIPIAYFPKFYHPDPSVKRQSGILLPQVNNSDVLGTSIILPYFHVISENKDITITPTIFDTKIYMLQNEYRQKNKNSYIIGDFGHSRGYKSPSANNKNSISHLFAKMNINFNNSFLDFNIEKVSNDTYLKIFDTNLIDKAIKPLDQNKLKSSVDLKTNNTNYNLSLSLSAYEDLTKSNNDRYQYLLPYYEYSKNISTNEIGNINFFSSGYNDLSDTNVLKTSLTNDIQMLSSDFFTEGGLKNNFGIYFKNLNTVGKNYSSYKSSPQSEIMSIFNLETSFPLIKYDELYNSYVTPKISIRTNPGSMKNYSDENRKIFANNIFSIDRLGIGSDSFESGTSITAGINFTKEKINDINKYFSFDLAAVFRNENENYIPSTSTINNTSSNLIGSSVLSMTNNYKIEYNFSLDNNLKDLEYNNIVASYYFKNFTTTFNFIEENGKIGATNSIENKTEVKFDDDKYLSFNTRRNRETNLTEYYDLMYEYRNDCLIANVKYKKNYYQDRDLMPEENLLFSITLFPITTLEQKVNQNLYKN